MYSPPRFPVILLQNDDYIGWSGFTGVGYPKTVPTAIADHVERTVPFYDDANPPPTSDLINPTTGRAMRLEKGMQVEGDAKKKFNLFVGASVGPEVEDRWARMDMCVHSLESVVLYGHEGTCDADIAGNLQDQPPLPTSSRERHIERYQRGQDKLLR